MPRKVKLPDAADFFSLSDAAPDTGGADEPAPRPELLPALSLPEGPTEKVTLYLHPLLLRRLELYKAQLLVEHDLKVSRSQIVEFLLEEGLRQAEALTEGLLARAE
jgi:hypothetical protein